MTNKDLSLKIDNLNEKVFAPLGIENPPYGLSPENHFNGASGSF